jgi:hypothetical protein
MAGIASGKLKSKGALDSLTKLIIEADNRETVLRHAGICGLVGTATPSELKGLFSHSSEALRIAAVVALRRQKAFEELMAFLDDPSPQVMSDAVRAIYDEASPQTFTDHPDVLSALAKCLHPSRPAPVNVRAIAANRRLGTIEAARRVVAFLVTPKLDPALRIEALYSLESWPDASTLDPMDGRHFPVSQGDPDALGEVAGPQAGHWPMIPTTMFPVESSPCFERSSPARRNSIGLPVSSWMRSNAVPSVSNGCVGCVSRKLIFSPRWVSRHWVPGQWSCALPRPRN